MREKKSPNHRTTSLPNTLSEKLSFLAHSDIFEYLNAAEINELEPITTLTAYPPGRIFYRPGEKGTTLFLLHTGRVQLYHLSTDGRKLIIATLDPGTCFGELPLFGQTFHTSFAETMEISQVCTMNRQDVEILLAQKPAVTLALLKVLGQRFTQLESQLSDTTFKSTSARLAALLLQLAHAEGKTLVVDGLSHEELAERLGVYRETVSTALRDLKDAGAITPGRKHITISQPTLLKEIASS